MSESKYREAYNKGFKDGENHAFDGYVQQCYDELPYEEQIELLVLRQIRNEIEAIDVTMGMTDYPFIPKAKVLEIIDKYQ